MTVQEFKQNAVVTEFDTTNGWGFGGGIGKMYTIGRYHIREGKAYYRHAPSHKFTAYYIENTEEVKDKTGKLYELYKGEGRKGKAQFEKAIKHLNK